MKQILIDQERIQLDRRVADVEKRTGAQIVLAVIERSDGPNEGQLFYLKTSAETLRQPSA